MNACFQEAAELGQLTSKVTRLYSKRLLDAETRFAERFPGPEAGKVTSNVPVSPWQTWQDWSSYLTDAAQRSLLFWDTIRRRGNQYLEHERAGKPPVLVYDYEMVVDGRMLERPVNYALVRILPPEGIRVDDSLRPYLIVDPRAGHGPGIGGLKEDSQVGVALRAGYPVYFVIFFPELVQGQTIRDVVAAQARFVEEVATRQPRGEGGGRAEHRLQHSPAARAAAQSLPGRDGRVPLFLRPQGHAGQVFVRLRLPAGRARDPG